ncbi:hypothetical protein JB92DRAFT_2903836 [Gautieria morchelliformis]|nr:hypothetical protein JB92DRAFT_2903836 [Gautieria morchelliformis]
MSKSRKLEKAMSVVQTADADGHKQIYSYSLEHMDPQGVPRISALVYGLARVLLPDMHWECTPELLDIFALAEAVRQQTVAGAREALLWDQFYRNDEATAVDGEPLTDEEKKILKTVARKSSNETQRETYRTVVMQVCWAHVHRLRRLNESFLIPLFFRQYFPSVGELRKAESTDECALWLRLISQTEFVAYEITRGKVIEFLEDAEQWEEEYFSEFPRAGKDPKAIRRTPEYQKAFCSRFPLMVGWDALTGILQRHLMKIQSMVAKLDSVFPNSSPESDVEENDNDEQRSLLRSRPQRKANVEHPTHPFSQPESQRNTENSMAVSESQYKDIKKESQESNVSSKQSYIDVPENVPHVPPTSLLGRVDLS